MAARRLREGHRHDKKRGEGGGEQVREYRDKLVEAVAESDDSLTAKYLEAGELTPEELTKGLKEGIKNLKIVPIAAGSALTEWLTGKSKDDLSAFQAALVEDLVGGLGAESKHAAVLCADAVKLLLKAS